MMYLENSEQSKVSREGEPATEAMLAEQCQIPKLTEAADFTGLSKRSAELGVQVLLEYTEQTVGEEMDLSAHCVEQCSMNSDEPESFTYCNGDADSFEQYSESDGFFESDQILDKCKTSELSQPCDECTQHCECFKSSEHCANHSLASECSPCCEQYAEHPQLFQKCKPSDQQLEISDFEADELEVNCDSLGQCERHDFIPECTDYLQAQQQYELSQQQSEWFDSEADGSTEDSEQCEAVDCDPELCEYNEISSQTEFTNDEDDEESEEEDNDFSCRGKQNDAEFSDEESHSSSEDTPVQVCFDDTENAAFATDFWGRHVDTQEDFQQLATTEVPTESNELCGNNYETSQNPAEQCSPSEQCNSESSGEEEEDGSSDCSSVETKSFKTCPDCNIASDPFSDSSGESEKEAQEHSSDEQTQWESFEDDEVHQADENKKKTADIIIEDYFDLFDKVDCHGHKFTQKQHYISCFDGGDIHDCLYLEEEAQKCKAKTLYQFEDINKEIDVKETDVCAENAPEDTYEEDASLTDGSYESEIQSEDWIIKSESSFEGDEESESENGAIYTENGEEAEDDEAPFDEETCAFDGRVSEEAEVCLSSGQEESMFAPCAKEISVEGDAYEDVVFGTQKYEPLGHTSTSDDTVFSADYTEDNKDKPEDSVLIACSEKEPYWSLVDNDDNGALWEPGVEEYYAYQIKSIQSSFNQALDGFIFSSGNERRDSLLSQKVSELEAAGVCPAECKSVTFGITEVIDMNFSAVDKECVLKEISRETGAPLGIIHSVEEGDAMVNETEDNEDSEQSRESEEEQSDDDSYEICECDYCITPAEQVQDDKTLSQSWEIQ